MSRVRQGPNRSFYGEKKISIDLFLGGSKVWSNLKNFNSNLGLGLVNGKANGSNSVEVSIFNFFFKGNFLLTAGAQDESESDSRIMSFSAQTVAPIGHPDRNFPGLVFETNLTYCPLEPQILDPKF